MNISAPFIRRPVMTILVTIALLTFGIQAYRGLPVSDLPNIDFPTIQVQASLPGANAETMASSVATPLERQFSTIAGMSSMSSVSGDGNTSITLQFDLERDLDAAALDVQAAIGQAVTELPPEMPSLPTFRKVNPADQPIIYIALTSPSMPLYQLDEYAETLLAQRISMVSGVAQVLVFGSQKYAVRVQVDPSELANRGIGLDQVAESLRQSNVNLPTGTLYGHHRQHTIRSSGQLTEAAAYRPLIVAYQNGQPVRLRELGRVIDSVQNDKTAAWYVKQRALVLAVQRQPGTNTVEVAAGVRDLLSRVRQEVPASVSLHVLYDRSETIRESVWEVQFTLMLALALVVLVIFLFLRNLRGTVIPAVAIPMSIVGTFIVMYALHFSVNNLTLLALTLSVGFVVDDAIVMLENIMRHLERGERLREAALNGSREIGFTIVSMTLSLAAVFIPVLFMAGIVGRLFREFAVTIGVAVLVSGAVSLSLTPMMCSRLLRRPGTARQGRVYAWSERVFERARDLYGRSLRLALRWRRSMMAFSGLVLALTLALFAFLPKGFLPSEDTNQIFAFTQAVEGISYEELVRKQQQVAAIIERDPDVRSFMSSAGTRGFTLSNQGVLFIQLKPHAERRATPEEIIERLRPPLSRVPGMLVFLQNPPPVRLGGRLTRAQYGFTLTSADPPALYRAADEMERRMRALPDLQDVSSDLQIRSPQVQVTIDRDRATALGVTAREIELTLGLAYGGSRVSTIYGPVSEYWVILEVLPELRRDPSALGKLYVRSGAGGLVPLEAVTRVRTGVGPQTINHTGQLTSSTISFNLRPGASLGPAVEQVQRLARELLPPAVSTGFEGAAQAFQSSLHGMGVLLVLAVLVIYIVLGVLYESFIHPVTILSALPFAAFGALATLLVFRVELNIYGFVGIIMLIGLVKKNGIMMIDFALVAQREQGRSPTDAIVEASLVRFRPIMMTTLSALLGTLPIAIGFGAGAGSRRPLGLAVVGGLLFSQFLTLFVTPVFYVYLDAARARLRRLGAAWRSRREPARES